MNSMLVSVPVRSRVSGLRRILAFEAALARRAAERAKTPIEPQAAEDDYDRPVRPQPSARAMLGALLLAFGLVLVWAALITHQ